MRTVWLASAAFFVGALVCIAQDRLDSTLMFAAIGFGLMNVAESNIDWRERLTRKDWRRSIFEAKWQTTPVGRVAQVLQFLCLFGFLVVVYR